MHVRWLGVTMAMLGAAAAAAEAPLFEEPVPPAWFGDVAVLEARDGLYRGLWEKPYARRTAAARARPAAGRQAGIGAGAVGKWRGRTVSLALNQDKAEAAALAESARLRLALPDLSMDAALTAGLGRVDDKADVWHRRGVSVAVNWINAPGGTKVSLSGTEDFSLTVSEPASLSGARRVLGTEKSRVAFAATLSPLHGVDLELGAAGSSETTRDSTPASRLEAIASTIETEGRAYFAKASWQPVPWLKLEAGGRETATAIAWRAHSAKSSEASSFAPRFALTLNLADTKLVTSLERTPATFNTDAFVAYARVAAWNETVPASPDRAWRFRAEMTRSLGPADLSAVYTLARDGSATEFGFSRSGAQVPVSTPLDEAEEVKLGLSLPLGDFGLYDTRLIGNAEWRDSSLRDPITGDSRRASGEVPAKLTLKLERRLPLRNMLVGFSGEVAAGQQSFRPGQITATDTNGRFGAYVAYTPGTYELRLAMDGIGTPGSTDTLFRGSRANALFPRTVERPAPGPTVKLSLRRGI